MIYMPSVLINLKYFLLMEMNGDIMFNFDIEFAKPLPN